jgi:pimeloyl-ACP methyl ester carboxylesterase
MPTPPTSQKPRRQQARLDPNRGATPPEMIELVDPSWILKAVGGLLAIGALCAYITLCIVFHYNQWQLVLHPSRTVTNTPAAFGLHFTEVHFAPDLSGQPQLDGWWIPSDSTTDPTILVLPSGDGSLSNALPDARTLHDARLNVLLFDYRGYGHSGGTHPTQALMQQDAADALTYLTTIRSIPLTNILVYGTGVGGALAVHLCTDHQSIPALILNAPDGDFTSRARSDSRSRIVPFGLLFNQTFPLADPLHTLNTPKLLISQTTAAAPEVFQRAADPKTTLELPTNDPTALQKALNRFLSAYVAHPAAVLIPNQ